MAEERIAQGRIDIEVNDREAISRLREVDKEFDRTMRDIERSSAEATIDANLSPFRDQVKNLRREIKKLEGERAEVELGVKKGDSEKLSKDIEKARLKLAAFDGIVAEAELKVKGADEFNKQQRAAAKTADRTAASIEKANARQARSEEKRVRENWQQVQRESRFRQAMDRQREREAQNEQRRVQRQAQTMRALENQRVRELTAAERQARQIDRERAQIPKLEASYQQLQKQLDAVTEARQKATKDGDVQLRVELDAKSAVIAAELKSIKSTIQAVAGRDPIELPVKLDPGNAFAQNLKMMIHRSISQGGGASGAVKAAGLTAGVTMGNAMSQGLVRTFNPSNLLSGAMSGTGKAFRKIGELTEMTVRIGPFTATIRQAATAMALFAPIILDVVGALGPLVAVVGSAAAGLGSLSAGFLGGAIPAALGFGLVIKGVAEEFGHVMDAVKAYDKAIREYGKNSPKAEKKLEILRSVLGHVSDETVNAFRKAQQLGPTWDKLTRPARAKAFEAIGAGINFAGRMMDRFAQRTNEGMAVASNEVQNMLDRLSSTRGSKTLDTLMVNFNRTLTPALRGLANLVGYLGKLGAVASEHIPGLAKQFERWSGALNDSANDTDRLTGKVDQQVESLRSLGRFLMSGGRLMLAFFAPGVKGGQDFLGTMTKAMDRWAAFLNTARGRNKVKEFFDEAVEGTQALWSNLAPIVSSFIRWAIAIAPIARGFFQVTGAVSGLVAKFLELTGLSGTLQGLGTTLAVLWGFSRIKKASDALQGFVNGLRGIGPAATRAASEAAVADKLTAPMTTGGAAAKTGGRFKGMLMKGLRGAGLLGIGVMAMDFIGKGMQTAAAREGFTSTFAGVGRDFLNTISFGLVDGAEEASGKAFKAMQDKLRSQPDLDLSKKIKFGRGISASTIDLTPVQRKMVEGMQKATQAADRIVRTHKLPNLTARVDVKDNPQDWLTLERNWNRMKNGLTNNLTTMKNVSAQSLRAIAKTMGTQSQEGMTAVKNNMRLTAGAINTNMKNGRVSAATGMKEIRNQFRTHSQASKATTQANFGAAAEAIRQAARDGVITSKQKLAELEKLWVTNLEMYGFSKKRAKNIAKTGDPDANQGREGGAFRARGGLINIGTPGQRGHDSVPMNLGGVPSIVAPGEQIAVFNRHQQAALGGMIPGGLEGFFGRNTRPHHMAGGGIVPVPGFPGERAATSILDEIAAITSKFGLRLTDAFGPGHKSPGHTIYGTAADFAGPDRSMDAAVRALVKAGYLVGYDGRFGSQRWGGHGPSYVAGSNAHLHVELGAKGGAIAGGIEAPTLKRIMATPGLGRMTDASQGVLDTARAAAQANLDKVAAQSLTIPTAGGGDGGAGAASRAQMVQWARAGLIRGGVFPPTPANIEKILTLAMKESSWNPRSMNNWDSNAKAGNPSGGLMHITIDKVGGSIMRLHDPVENIAVSSRYQKQRYGRLVTHSPYAAGGIVGFQTMPRARGGRVDQPTLMTGETDREYVINTQRRDNLPFLKMAAAEMGIPMAQGGTSPHPTGRGYTGVGDSRKKHSKLKPRYSHGAGGNVTNLPEAAAYEKAKDKENDQNRRISIAEGRIREPETMIKQVGTDPAGEPIYAVDEAKVNEYAAQMGAVMALHEGMIKIVHEIIQRYNELVAAINDYIQQRFSSISTLQNIRGANKRIMDAKLPAPGKTKATKDRRTKAEASRTAAKERIAKIDEMIAGQRTKIKDAREYRDDTLAEERQDIGFRSQEYANARADLRERISSLGKKAADEAASANPKPGADESAQTAAENAQRAAEFERDRAVGFQQQAETRMRVSEAGLAAFGSSGDIGEGIYRNAFSSATGGIGSVFRSSAGQAISSGSAAGAAGAPRFDDKGGLRPGAGGGGVSGGSGGVTININTLSGADPEVARSLAGVAAAGFGMQGYRSATTVPAGI